MKTPAAKAGILKTRLGKRLNALFEAIPSGYDSIWDLCCDHGRLGLALLESERTGQVHFVDQVDSIITGLSDRLERFGASGYTLHTLPAQQLELPERGHHLLVLAGVGDEVSRTIIDTIASRESDIKPDWLISPANNLFQVRRYLEQRDFGLLSEGVVFENGRGYEWLLVTQDRQRACRPVPNPAEFWRPEIPQHRAHLKRLVGHARNQLNNPLQQDARAMLALYQPLLNSD